MHKQFILQLTSIRSRVLGHTNKIELNDIVDNITLWTSILNDSISNNGSNNINNNDITSILSIWNALSNEIKTIIINKKLPNIHIEEFEKDDLSLNHVELIMLMSNLRCQVYNLPLLDRLQIHKIAGNIIPALATTTSLVAGLVTIEIIKIAIERVLYKRYIQEQYQEEKEEEQLLKQIRTNNNITKPSQISFTKSLFKNIFHQSSIIKTLKPINNKNVTHVISDKLLNKDYSKKHQNRLLSIFRNSFVNLARPMLAFAQPIECTEYPYVTMLPSKDTHTVSSKDIHTISSKDIHTVSSKDTYNLWDTIEV